MVRKIWIRNRETSGTRSVAKQEHEDEGREPEEVRTFRGRTNRRKNKETLGYDIPHTHGGKLSGRKQRLEHLEFQKENASPTSSFIRVTCSSETKHARRDTCLAKLASFASGGVIIFSTTGTTKREPRDCGDSLDSGWIHTTKQGSTILPSHRVLG